MARKWPLPKLHFPKLRLPKWNPRHLLAIAADGCVRIYSLAILALLVWAGYLAVSYLRSWVFEPPQIPQRLQNWQGRLDVAALRQNNVPGMTGPEGRAPPGHFHGIDRWFQADKFNTCTTTGCHQPLPHTTKAKVPAFGNFHATFLECQMCHTDVRTNPDQPAQAMWLNLATGKVEDCPPILSLQRYLDTQSDAIAKNPAAAHQVITDLLGQAISAIGRDPALEELLHNLQTSDPGSPFWHQAEKSLVAELPLHARGEYAAKLAPPSIANLTADQRQAMVQLAGQCLAAPADSPQRKEIQQAIHKGLYKEPVACTTCHSTPSLLDFKALGYSPQRADALHSVPLARTVQSIRDGEQFYIPQLLETP